MMFVMSLGVDSSLAVKSPDSHSQAITHTRCGPRKPGRGAFKEWKMLLFEAVVTT